MAILAKTLVSVLFNEETLDEAVPANKSLNGVNNGPDVVNFGELVPDNFGT